MGVAMIMYISWSCFVPRKSVTFQLFVTIPGSSTIVVRSVILKTGFVKMEVESFEALKRYNRAEKRSLQKKELCR